MNKKLLLVLWWIILIWGIWVWIYALSSFLGWNKEEQNLTADIGQAAGNRQQGTDVGNDWIVPQTTGDRQQSADNIDFTEPEGTGEENAAQNNLSGVALKVAIPEYFDTTGWKLLKIQYEKKYNQKVEFVKISSLKDYESQFQQSGTWSYADVYILPFEWTQSYPAKFFRFELKDGLKQLFHSSVSEVFNSNWATFVPYILDPMVSFVSTGMGYDKRIFDIYAMKEKFLLNPSGWSRLSLNFWISPIDLLLLWKGSSAYPEYSDILYNVLYQSYLSQNPDFLELFVDYASSKQQFWNYSTFQKLQRILVKVNQQCEEYSQACFLWFKKSDVILGYLSTLDQAQQYAKQNNVLSGYILANFPTQTNIYPIRVWGLAVDKNTPNLTQGAYFINEYINVLQQKPQSLYKGSLSAYSNYLSTQLNNPDYSRLKDNSLKFRLILWMKENINYVVKQTNLLDALKKDYSLSAYLENLTLLKQ